MTRKSILITGCSSGIGYAAAKMLHARGWRVFASCRKAEDCARLQAEGLASPLIDYEDTATIESGLAEVLAATGGTLDAVFNNGAYGIPGPVEDLPTDALRQIFEANFFGWHELTRRIIPIMRSQGSGHIVQCSSVLGFVTMPWRGAYNATKYAIEGLTDTLRIEMRGSGVRVVLIQPGPIRTKIRENSIPHFEKWVDWKNSLRKDEYETGLMRKLYKGSEDAPFELEPEAVAEKLWLALEDTKPRTHYMVTTPTYLMAICRRLLPRSLLDNILSRG